MTKTTHQQLRKKLSYLLFLPLLVIGLLLVPPEPSLAASGGRIGGGSFRAPSIPRTGGYGGSYRGGYGGGYGRGYRSGGLGFPFIVPFFGFGGGGLFGFLILMAVVGVIGNAFRGDESSQTRKSFNSFERKDEPISMIQLQMGLLAKAKEIQSDLRAIADSSDTSNSIGLQKILQETTLSLLRQPDLWVYANLETGNVPFSSAESTFNKLSMIERSKLKAEIITNYSGQKTSLNSAESNSKEADETNEYIAITIIAASRTKLGLSDINSSEQLQEILRSIGSIPSNDLIALEIIWQPEGTGEVLTGEDLVISYPNLKYL
tara:strand:- start:655 stop:1611 length:957 start_codon:yes stop_codon:yes gene_type:complete